MSGASENAGQVTPARYLLLNIGRPIPASQCGMQSIDSEKAQTLGAARNLRGGETKKWTDNEKGGGKPAPSFLNLVGQTDRTKFDAYCPGLPNVA